MVDKEMSFRNQARFQAINQDYVVELAIAAEQYELPPMVGYYKDSKIIIIDGNHRIEAYLTLATKVTKSDFYIVDTTHPWVIDRLTRGANTLNGVSLSKEEKINHAMHLVRTQGVPAIEAAKIFGLTEPTMKKALHASDVQERLAIQGFTDRIVPSTLQSMYRIKQDKALLRVAQLVKEALLSSDETNEVARRVERASKSEKDQEHVISQFFEDFRGRIAKGKDGQIRTVVDPIRSFRKAVNIINATRPVTVKPLDSKLLRRTREAVKKLEEILSNGTTG